MTTHVHSGGSRRRPGRIAAVSSAAAVLALTQIPASTSSAAESGSLIKQPGYVATTVTVSPGVLHTNYTHATNDLVVNVLRVDPDAGAISLGSTLGGSLAQKETTSAMLKSVSDHKSRRPFAGVNGSYSVSGVGQSQETDANGGRELLPSERSIGQGVSVQEDVVQSAACYGRDDLDEAVVLQYGRPHFTQLNTELTLKNPANGTWKVDGVNRNAGWMTKCAQGPGDTRVTQDEFGNSMSYLAYQDADEIVTFTSAYGQTTPRPNSSTWVKTDNSPETGGPQSQAEIAVDAQGTVVAWNASGRGGMVIPAGGRVFQGIGTGADWLRPYANDQKAKLTYTEKVTDQLFGEELKLDPANRSIDVVNGTHLLVRNGKVNTPTNEEDDPRTAFGVDSSGRTLLVTVTSKRPHVRNGVPTPDLAKIMGDLDAVDAVNLDGGGSTTMMVENKVVTTVSDGSERPVFDAVYAGRGGFGLYESLPATLPAPVTP
ncbi:phosphodiester glycosidase family protein [Streptomyces sp. NPDC056773]|uniref:phosphodiester glycosidase family protein n=1 Tax=unclassified Streptomyces TaxID=2593676 RepID=UPI0036856AC4